MKVVGYILISLIVVSLIVMVFAWVKKDDLPAKETMLELMLKAPLQEKLDISEDAFTLEKEGFTYTITPRYKYEIFGLSVADYDSENWFDFFHRRDPLNTKDICLVWGSNIESGSYQESKFKHGEFTCFWKPEKQGVSFNTNEISNNHLLPSNEEIYQKIKESETGDQIYIKGYLANYTISGPDTDFQRTSSITRDDTGNGACEIIYVTDFKVLAKGNPGYDFLYKLSRNLLIFSIIVYLIIYSIHFSMMRPIKKKEIVEEFDYDPARRQSFPAAFNPPDKEN